ncbi:S-Ena type endospore appendage [Marininema mesophilum]|uniref:S-Ena type endospore appendage n=1 Tax=Marininema mesophilum TaxID=1048340 RepID=UPI003CCB9B89
MNQLNKQVNIVKVGECCRFKRKYFRKTANEKICGNIFQLCDAKPRLYYRAVDVFPSALVQIENKSNSIMIAFIKLRDGRIISDRIGQEQQVSFNVPSIQYLRIACISEETSYCRGSYVLFLRSHLIRWRRRRVC